MLAALLEKEATHATHGPIPRPILRPIPPTEDWSELTQLEVIRLDQNNLKGPLPAAWSKLVNLRWLTLWDNKLTGEVPTAWADMKVGWSSSD